VVAALDTTAGGQKMVIPHFLGEHCKVKMTKIIIVSLIFKDFL